MKTILVDDEMLSLENFKMECETIPQVEVAGCFEFPLDALEYAKHSHVDCAVLDITMPEMDGLTLGKMLQKLYPDIVLIYVTGYGEYAQEAMAMRAATYIMKPYSREDILFAMNRAKLLTGDRGQLLTVKTFGRFSVFKENKPVMFRNAKAKELFALCVEHNGGEVTMEEAIDKLWEDRPYSEQTKALYRKAVMSLRKVLAGAKADGAFITKRGSCYVEPDRLDCDYFGLLEGDGEMIDAYMGEFMADYSWAETTAARLTRIVRKHERQEG